MIMTPSAARKVTYGVGVLFIAIASMLATVVVTAALDSPAFDPLGDYPLQTVDEITATTITTTGTKCNDSQLPVEIVGEFNWFRVEPPGFATAPAGGTRTVDPGCTTKTFQNDIPAEVLAINKPGAVWFITGTEYPIDDGGNRGVPRTWQTENFTIPEPGGP